MNNTKYSREAIINKRKYRPDILGDELSLYISNYPQAAKHLIKKIKGKGNSVVELCCGIGVTLELLADNFPSVIGVDIDNQVLIYCDKNLQTAGLRNKVTLVQGDINQEEVLKNIKADLVIYDIPYWNIGLTENTGLDQKNPKLEEIIHKIRHLITKNIVIFSAPHFTKQMADHVLGENEFEEIYINGKHDRNYIYLGELAANNVKKEIEL